MENLLFVYYCCYMFKLFCIVKKFFRLLYYFYFLQFEILENDDDCKFINIEKMFDDNVCVVSFIYYSKVFVKF